MSKGQIRTIQAKYDQTAFSNTAQPERTAFLPGAATRKSNWQLVHTVLVPFLLHGLLISMSPGSTSPNRDTDARYGKTAVVFEYLCCFQLEHLLLLPTFRIDSPSALNSPLNLPALSQANRS